MNKDHPTGLVTSAELEKMYPGLFKKTRRYELLNAGLIKARKVGKRTWFVLESIEQYLANQPDYGVSVSTQQSGVPVDYSETLQVLPKDATGTHVRKLLEDVSLFLSGMPGCTCNGLSARDLIARINVKLG